MNFLARLKRPSGVALAPFLLTISALHVVLMAAYWPDALTNTDESMYVTAAMDFASGSLQGHVLDIETLQPRPQMSSAYPAGTSALQSLLIIPFGWRGAFALSLFGLLVTVWACRSMLLALEQDEWLALLVLLFPPMLVLTRAATSDAINMACVSVALAAFFKGIRGPPWQWWLAGVCGGLVLVFREATILVVAPLFLGALLRRDPGVHRLVIGGLIGAAVRPISAAIVFGNPLFRHPGYGTFALSWLWANTPFYLAMTLIVLPGGLLALLAYRGRRAPEIIGGALAYSLLHAAYFYGASESGGPHTIVTGGRYLMPALPLFIVAMAAGLARLNPPAVESSATPRWHWSWLGWIRPLLALGAVASLGIHPAMRWWSRPHADAAMAICKYVPADARVIINWTVLSKAVAPAYCDRAFIDYSATTPEQLARWSRDSHPLYLAIGIRTDSPDYTSRNAGTLRWLDSHVHPDQRRAVYEASGHAPQVHIWQVVRPL